ncbi:MAG: proton-conducting transporter membrane subunit [Bacillota bacterium]
MHYLATYPALCIGIPLAAAVLAGFGLRPKRLAVAAAGLVLVVIACCYPQGSLSFPGPTLLPGTQFTLRLDLLGWLLALTAASLWFLAACYSLAYLHGGRRDRPYHVAFLLTLAGAQGTFLAGDLFTLFVAFEVMSLAAYPLVVHESTPAARRAGAKYLYLSVSAGVALFTAVMLTWWQAGSLELGRLELAGPWGKAALSCYLLAFALKAGLVPLHIWLPDAHPVAPSPASALLSGIMIKAGAYGLFRIVFEVVGTETVRALGWQGPLLAMAVASMVLGSVAAFLQADVKRRLAYSSIAQMGYIALGISLLTRAGLAAAIYHATAHAAMKSLLFLAAGVMLWAGERRRVDDWRGVASLSPVAAGAFTVGGLAMIGLPPLNGFVGKWELGLAALETGSPWLAGLLILSGLANAAYYLPLVNLAWFADHAESHGGDHQAYARVPAAMLWPLLVLAAACLGPLLGGNLVLVLARRAAGLLLP